MKLGWIWRSLAAGLCGSAAHTLLMLFKTQSGLLPGFQPYDALQRTLSQFAGADIHPLLPWALSFLNGAVLMGLVFGRIYPWLPSENGATKGFVFGVAGWLVMGLVFFPLIGLGVFGAGTADGFAPALFSLAMLLAYSLVTGIAYAWLRGEKR